MLTILSSLRGFSRKPQTEEVIDKAQETSKTKAIGGSEGHKTFKCVVKSQQDQKVTKTIDKSEGAEGGREQQFKLEEAKRKARDLLKERRLRERSFPPFGCILIA